MSATTTQHQRAGRDAETQLSQRQPAQSVSEHADGDRPGQHAQRRREKDAVCRDGDTGGDYVLPQRDGPPSWVGWQRNTEHR